MKRLLFILAIVVAQNTCLGQGLELFNLEYGYYPNAAVSERDSTEINFKEIEISAMLPVWKGDKLNILAGGVYREVFPESDEASLQFQSDLLFLGLKLMGVYKLADNHQLLIQALPAISITDDTKLFGDGNFLMQGGVFYNKIVSERFSYRLGVLSTSRFGAPIVLPSFGLTHTGEKMRLNMNLPFLIQATWAYNNPFSYGMKLAVNGSQYNVDSQDANEVDLIRLSRVRIGPELQYRIKGPLVFTVFGGVAANRTYEFERVGSDDIDFSLENGPFVSFSLSLKPQLLNN